MARGATPVTHVPPQGPDVDAFKADLCSRVCGDVSFEVVLE
jgi:hypothetical protein